MKATLILFVCSIALPQAAEAAAEPTASVKLREMFSSTPGPP
jgi:hypothetical protein